MVHLVYLIYSANFSRCYIGYTVNITRRLRQHNGEITGGAKKTAKYRPWQYILHIEGFEDNHEALQFEWRWQKIMSRKRTIASALQSLQQTLLKGNGSIKNNDKRPWSKLSIVNY